jgi:hypothetical protein
MIQRGEIPFVAMRVGRLHDPREVTGFAFRLKERPCVALIYVLLWEEFILEVGDALTGRLKGYRAEDIAAKLTYEGKPATLIKAMESAGLLRRQRSTFLHPYWLETPTGQYALQRAERREGDRERKRRQRERDALALAEALAAARGETSVTRDIPVTSAGRPGDSTVNPEIKKERKKGQPDPDAPPSPPQGGGSLGKERWERIQGLFNSPMNDEGCERLLGVMTPEKWALCLWVLENRDREGLSSLSRKKRAFGLDSYKFLRTEAFRQFRPEYLKKLNQPKEPDPVATAAENARRELEKGRRSLRELLDDPDCPETVKDKRRRLWLDAHPDDAEWLATIAPPSPSTPSNGVSN